MLASGNEEEGAFESKNAAGNEGAVGDVEQVGTAGFLCDFTFESFSYTTLL